MDKLYKDLLKEGWKMKDIDEMDINYFLDLNGNNENDAEIDIEDFYKRI